MQYSLKIIKLGENIEKNKNNYDKYIIETIDNIIKKDTTYYEDKNIVFELLTQVLIYITSNNVTNYKYKYDANFKYLEYMYNKYISSNINKNYINTYHHNFIDFFEYLQIIKGSEKILYSMIDNIKFIRSNSMNKIISKALKYGTLPIVDFWIKYIRQNNSELFSSLEYHFVFYNTDDRVYKYITSIPEFNIKNIYSFVYKSINIIFSNKNIPDKYILRRIKKLSSLHKFDKIIFDTIVSSCNNFKLLITIFKYNNASEYYINDNSVNYYNFLTHKYFLNDNANNYYDIDYDYFFNNIKILENYFSSFTIDCFVLNVFNSYCDSSKCRLLEYKLKNGIECKDKFISYLDKITMFSGIFNKYFYNILPYEIVNSLAIGRMEPLEPHIYNLGNFKYIDISDCDSNKKNICIKHNLLLFHIKVFIRKKEKYYNLYKKYNNIRIAAIINSYVKKYTPTNVLFERYPYSYYPTILNSLKSKIIISEKADGELVYNLPKNAIFPDVNFTDKIKAEYIEDLDLYLVFDIDNGMKPTERYNYLRNLHPYTKNTLINIIDFKRLKEYIENERRLFEAFLNEPYISYRWYPKAAWIIHNITPEYIDILNSMTTPGNDLMNYITNEGPYKNDGIIISPLNGDREIKLKPRNLLTIDLKFTGFDWVDNDNFTYNDIIKMPTTDIILKENLIYRCYPIDNTTYEPREIRMDKKKPNPRNVVNNIMCLYNIDYSKKYPYIYNQLNKYINCDTIWNKIIEANNNVITKFINMNSNDTILDLGCGKGKILKFVKNYNKYYGMDYDMNSISRANILYNSPKNIFNYINLAGEWNKTENKLYQIDHNIKYNTIYCINSLMHFCTELFWEQLDKMVMIGTKLNFNIVNNSLESYYFDTKSYIVRNNDMVKYFFEYIHINEMSEQFINKEMLQYYLDKYNWKIEYVYTSDKELLRYYDWYCVVKY